MIPKEKVQEIIAKYNSIEKELSSGNIEAKLYAKKSKEYSNLKSIITAAKEYFNFEIKEKDLDQIIEDKDNDPEIIEMAERVGYKDIKIYRHPKLRFGAFLYYLD